MRPCTYSFPSSRRITRVERYRLPGAQLGAIRVPRAGGHIPRSDLCVPVQYILHNHAVLERDNSSAAYSRQYETARCVLGDRDRGVGKQWCAVLPSHAGSGLPLMGSVEQCSPQKTPASHPNAAKGSSSCSAHDAAPRMPPPIKTQCRWRSAAARRVTLVEGPRCADYSRGRLHCSARARVRC